MGTLVADYVGPPGLLPSCSQSGLIAGDFETGFTTATFRARQEAAAVSSAAPSQLAPPASGPLPTASATSTTLTMPPATARAPSRPSQPAIPKADSASASVTKRTCRPCLVLSSRCYCNSARVLYSPFWDCSCGDHVHTGAGR